MVIYNDATGSKKYEFGIQLQLTHKCYEKNHPTMRMVFYDNSCKSVSSIPNQTTHYGDILKVG